VLDTEAVDAKAQKTANSGIVLLFLNNDLASKKKTKNEMVNSMIFSIPARKAMSLIFPVFNPARDNRKSE
jgi:hypothetical protein